ARAGRREGLGITPRRLAGALGEEPPAFSRQVERRRGGPERLELRTRALRAQPRDRPRRRRVDGSIFHGSRSRRPAQPTILREERGVADGSPRAGGLGLGPRPAAPLTSARETGDRARIGAAAARRERRAALTAPKRVGDTAWPSTWS